MTEVSHAPALPALLLAATFAAGCISHQVETQPIEIKPIHITMDINLRVQRELDEFFDFEEKAEAPAGETTKEPAKQGMPKEGQEVQR